MQRGILPLLPTKGGEGRGEEGRFYLDSPLPNPLPTRSSRGEGGDPKRQRRLIQWQWGSRVRGHASSTGCENSCTGSGCPHNLGEKQRGVGGLAAHPRRNSPPNLSRMACASDWPPAFFFCWKEPNLTNPMAVANSGWSRADLSPLMELVWP